MKKQSDSGLFGVIKRLQNGSAIIEDDSIGVRVTVNPDGSGKTESTIARRESMVCHAHRINAMVAEAQAMLPSGVYRDIANNESANK